MIRTFLDCGTHVEAVPRSLVSEEEPALSAEEQVLVDTINEHDTITVEQVIQAAELMVTESCRLPSGSYPLVSIAKMFLDFADRAITAPSPSQVQERSRRPPPGPADDLEATASVMTVDKAIFD